MRRRLLLLVFALLALLFVAVSALLARAFSVDGAERSAVIALVEAQARGDAGAVLSELYRCRQRPACRLRARTNAATLKRAGPVSILQLEPSSGFSLTGSTGSARVAWSVGRSRPIVQCVQVRRAGNVLRGLRVELLALTPRLKSDAHCPARF
jgi:hypothetical protein